MAQAHIERRLSAILAADVVGYSRLMEADEANTLAGVKDLLGNVFEPLIAEHGGRTVKLMGDGLLAEFASVVDATACAVAVQKGVASRQKGAVPEQRIVYRIGINLGDVVVEGDDLLGDGVNIAARLQQLCKPGHVLISGTAYDHLQGKLKLAMEDMGEQQVKNIARPVRAYLVRIDGAHDQPPPQPRSPARRYLWPALVVLLALVLGSGSAVWWLRSSAPAIAAKPSIAVLPFDDYGSDDATARLANGITEDIITDLARFPEFAVVARNSTGVYKGKAVDTREVSRALNVDFVLEGSIQRDGERARITVQLIDGKSGTHVWSQRWDKPVGDVFAVQTEIAEQVGNRLGGGAGLIQTVGREVARRKRPDNLSAYELYLLGTEKLEQTNREAVEDSIRLLTRAVELDPGLARAWIELSHARNMAADFGVDRTEAKQAALAAAERAVELDPNDAEAHAALAMRLAENGELARAEAAFETALGLNPGSAEILIFYAAYASSFGKPERAAEAADQAIRLNPNYPTWAAGPFSFSYFMSGRYEDALRMLERVPQQNYTIWRWVVRIGSYAALDRVAEASESVQQALQQFPDLTIEGFVSDPGMSDAERQRFIETLGKAGVPACATPQALAVLDDPVRLAHCPKS